MSGERRTNSSVGRESTRTTTRQRNYRYRDAKAASCMCLMRADGDKQRGCTNFWSFVVLQHCLYRDGLVCGELDGTEMLQRVRGRSWLRRTRNPCETGTVSALLALTNFGPTALENKKTSQSSTGGIPRGEAVNVFSGKSLKEATVVPSAKCDGVRLARTHGETRSTLLLSIGCSFWPSFQPPSLRLHDGSCAVRIRPGCATAVYLQRGIHGRTSTCNLGKNWIP